MESFGLLKIKQIYSNKLNAPETNYGI